MSRTKDITNIKLVRLENPQFDPQRGSLYRMEREWVGTCLHSETRVDYLDSLGMELCKLYNVEPPDLAVGEAPHKDDMGEYFWEPPVVTLYYPNGVNILIYLHELAHHITHELFDDMTHSPRYAAVLRYLLHKTRCVSRDAFNIAAEQWGVKVHHEDRPSALYRRRYNANV